MNFMEIINKDANKNEAGRCLRCKNARCAQACPVHTDVPVLMGLYKESRLDEAADILFANNPFSAITSQICDWSKVCYGHCILNAKKMPVNWHSIEFEIAGEALFRTDIAPGESNGRRVAIIGAGPAGISAAFWLRQAGFGVSLFDANKRPGGVLRYGIPEFRLDRKYVDRYEVMLQNAGVEFHGNTSLGKDIGLSSLRKEYDAVLIAAGANIPRRLNIPGEEHPDIIYALDYLRNPSEYELGRKVLVIGGGNVTMDACRTANRNGHDTWVYYRKSFADMPANSTEVEEAKEEGVQFRLFEVPVAINGHKAVMRKCENIVRPDGRLATRMIEDTDHEVEFDSMLVAISANVDFNIFGEDSPAKNNSGWPEVDETQRTSLDNVFVAGDFILGPSTVVNAVASAKTAVNGIIRLFG